MVSTETALDYLKKKHEAESAASGQPEEKATPETEDKPETQGTEQTTVQESATEKKEEPVKTDDSPAEKEDAKPSEQAKDEVKSDENDTEKSEPKREDKPVKRKYTHEERVAHKFAKQSEKLRERSETIRKQQETIDSLNKELEKYKGLKLEDFENNMEAYADWKVKEASMQNEVKFRKEMMEREQREAAELETARREELSFEDEDEREEYREMLRINGPNFYDALQKADADYMHPNGRGDIAKTVLNYLSTVDRYPVVLKQLMDLKTGALRKVFSGGKDPDIIKSNLHQLTQELLSEQKKPSADSVAQKPQNAPKPIPVIGKQTTANSKPSEPVHDKAFWTNYAKNHR